MRKLLLILLISFFLFSCSPTKRLARLVKNHPELVSHDTIFKSDTTILNGVQHDTIFRTQITKDTIIIKDKQLTIKYYNDGKNTYIKGECDTVFVIKKIPVVVNSVNPVDIIKTGTWYDKWLIRPFAIIALLFILLDQIAARKK